MNGFAEDKTAPYVPPMAKAEFLRWLQVQDQRHELSGGRVVMQAGGTKRHNWICINFVTALKARLDKQTWSVGMADVAVEIGDDIRYPDVLAERHGDDDRAVSTDKPVLLVEVLSPSSAATDLGAKLAQYTGLASLETYIVASQDEALCWVWNRIGEARTFPVKPAEFRGRDQVLALDAFAIHLPLAELYDGVRDSG